MVKRPKIVTNMGPEMTNVTIITHVVQRPDSTTPLTIKPYKLDISQIGIKPRTEMKFIIHNNSENDLNLTLIDYPRELASVEIPASIAAGKTGRGLLKLTPEGVEAKFNKSLTIQVDDEHSTRFTVPVKRGTKSDRVGPPPRPPKMAKPGDKRKGD